VSGCALKVGAARFRLQSFGSAPPLSCPLTVCIFKVYQYESTVNHYVTPSPGSNASHTSAAHATGRPPRLSPQFDQLMDRSISVRHSLEREHDQSRGRDPWTHYGHAKPASGVSPVSRARIKTWGLEHQRIRIRHVQVWFGRRHPRRKELRNDVERSPNTPLKRAGTGCHCGFPPSVIKR
jgi:hypothetical protein